MSYKIKHEFYVVHACRNETTLWINNLPKINGVY